jgi:DNA-binding transcriptional ArsR family regulator
MNGANEADTRAQDAIACLAVPSRFRLVRAIAEADRCVGELALRVGLSQSCTTRHLQALARAGLVVSRRDGRHVRFRLRTDTDAVHGLLEIVLGGEAPPSRSISGGAEYGMRRDSRASAAPRARRSAKPLPKGDLGRAASSDSAAGLADGPEPAEPGEASVDRPKVPSVPYRRQDIEDYLL